MAKSKRPQSSTPSKKIYFSNYPQKSENHRKRRVERHLKANPDDLQTKKSLEKGLAHRGAKKPVGRGLPVPSVFKDEKGKIYVEHRRIGKRIRPQQQQTLEFQAFAKRVHNEMQHRSSKRREEDNEIRATYTAQLDQLKRDLAKRTAISKKAKNHKARAAVR